MRLMPSVLRCRAMVVPAASGTSSALAPLLKDYRALEALRRQEAEAIQKQQRFKDVPLRYQLLEVLPGSSLAMVKVKYLMACRRHHPEVGGDPEMFLRVSLAYQDCMKDYGLETVDNRVVNLGNPQSDAHELQNYLENRARIASYIPLSTLDDHIRQLESVHARLGAELCARLSDNSDEAMWLLEDVEKIVELTGISTAAVELLEDGSVKLVGSGVDTVAIPIDDDTNSAGRAILPRADTSFAAPAVRTNAKETSAVAVDCNNTSNSCSAASSHDATGGPAVASSLTSTDESDEYPGSGGEAGSAGPAVRSISLDDLAVLNAKHQVEKRRDIAGIAARVATGVMNNTREKQSVRMESVVAVFVALNLGFLGYAYYDTKMRAKAETDSRPEVKQHLAADTLLPWWGNDAEYESQVKRLFLDEWRRARSGARRQQVFQEGVARESLPVEEKEALDVSIFSVTAEKIREIKAHAEAQRGRQ